MKAIIKPILIIHIVIFFASCTSILDLKPLDSVSESAVWEDPALIELYVNSRYKEMPHGFVRWAGSLRLTGITDETYHMHEPRCDNYTNGGINSGNMYFYNAFWGEAYRAIKNDNVFLANFKPEIIGDEAKAMRLQAEIRTIRAYFTEELAMRYGDIPLVKNIYSLEEDFTTISRTDKSEVFDWCVSELDECIPYLYSRGQAVGGEFGKITKGFAIGLKIRALMWKASPLVDGNGQDKAKWEQVAKACEELFELGEYSLSSDYKGMFLNANDPEIIFFKQFIDLYGDDEDSSYGDGYCHRKGGHRIDEWRFPNGSGGWVSENPLQTMVDQYETLSGVIPVLGYDTTGGVDNYKQIINPEATDYDPLHPYENRDPRLDMSVYHDESWFQGRQIEMWYDTDGHGGLDSRDPDVDWYWNGSKLGYGIMKCLDESWTYTSTVGSDTPWIYMRLAEFYLTYAEAQYHLGNEAKANEYVNKIRSRQGVNMPPISASGEDLLTKIKHERRIELAFEGNRFYDARRWNDAVNDFSQDAIGVSITYDRKNNTKSYRYFRFNERIFPEHNNWWPIPEYEIKKSTLEQNPGY